jgi:hypothetical protein
MNTTRFPILAILLFAITAIGCNTESSIVAADAGLAADSPSALEAVLGKVTQRPTAWADGEVYQSLVTPATFKPTSGNFDELYAGGNGFKDGIPLISESKPGDRDYNGGRWHLNVLKEGVDPDKYMHADSVEDLDLDDFESTSDYFECPLLPRRGKNN